MVARRNPTSKRVSLSCGPREKKRLGHVNKFASDVLSSPAPALRVSVGKYAARATPICALAWAMLRSPAATSGRLSRSCEGTPVGVAGGLALRAGTGIENDEGGLPTSTAMACSY